MGIIGALVKKSNGLADLDERPPDRGAACPCRGRRLLMIRLLKAMTVTLDDYLMTSRLTGLPGRMKRASRVIIER
jgi:hypothetical protein